MLGKRDASRQSNTLATHRECVCVCALQRLHCSSSITQRAHAQDTPAAIAGVTANSPPAATKAPSAVLSPIGYPILPFANASSPNLKPHPLWCWHSAARKIQKHLGTLGRQPVHCRLDLHQQQQHKQHNDCICNNSSVRQQQQHNDCIRNSSSVREQQQHTDCIAATAAPVSERARDGSISAAFSRLSVERLCLFSRF